MQVAIPPAFETFAREQVAAGRFASEQDVVTCALETYLEGIADLRTAVEGGFSSLDRGEGVDGPSFHARPRRGDGEPPSGLTCLVSGPAIADLRDIRDWIAEGDPQRAAHDLEELEALFARLAARSLVGRPRNDIGPGVRSMVHRNDVVFHRPGGDKIEISRVLPG